MPYTLREVCLEITDYCPMACIYCSSFNPNERNHQMKFEDVKSTIWEIKKLGGKILEISGGEPTTHPKLNEIIAFAKSKGLETRLYTSGFTFSEDENPEAIDEKYIKDLKEAGLNKIIFNLQAADPTLHEEIMGRLNIYHQLLEAIRAAKKQGLWNGIHFVPMEKNKGEMEATTKLARELGVDEIAFLRFVAQGKGKINREKLEIDEDGLPALVSKIVKLTRKYGAEINVRAGCPLNYCSLFDEQIPPRICKAARTTCLIKPNGDVVPCPAFKQSIEYVAGNIHHSPLQEIWRESPIFDDLRNFNYKMLKGDCKDCPELTKCQGKCTAQRIIQYGGIEKGPDKCAFRELVSPEREKTTSPSIIVR